MGCKGGACLLSGDLCKRRRRTGCHSYPAGTQLLSLVWASLSLIPARPLFPQHWLLCFQGENVVFVLPRETFHPSPALVGTSQGGALCEEPVPGSWGDKGRPCPRSPPCVGCIELSELLAHLVQIPLCRGWRGSSGQTASASLF